MIKIEEKISIEPGKSKSPPGRIGQFFRLWGWSLVGPFLLANALIVTCIVRFDIAGFYLVPIVVWVGAELLMLLLAFPLLGIAGAAVGKNYYLKRGVFFFSSLAIAIVIGINLYRHPPVFCPEDMPWDTAVSPDKKWTARTHVSQCGLGGNQSVTWLTITPNGEEEDLRVEYAPVAIDGSGGMDLRWQDNQILEISTSDYASEAIKSEYKGVHLHYVAPKGEAPLSGRHYAQ